MTGVQTCALPISHGLDPQRVRVRRCGGDSRSESVLAGLAALLSEGHDPQTWVLVHDAARPFVSQPTVDRVVTEVRAGRGAIPALPVVDTLKEVDADGRITRTVDRARLWRAQTPQGFPRDMIAAAHARGLADGVDATDDAALCERLGHQVIVVPGSERAMKVTTEADFARAESLWKAAE